MSDLRRALALDPWAALTMKMYADAFAAGYAQALRDNDHPPIAHTDLVTEAMHRLESDQARYEHEALIALAKVGPLIYNEFKNPDEGGTT